MNAGERLRTWRKENKISSTEAAHNIGLSQSGLTRFETGNTDISSKYLLNLHEKYDLSIDWLLTGANGQLPTDQQELLEIYEQLPPDRREDLLDTARMYLGKVEDQRSSTSRKAG